MLNEAVTQNPSAGGSEKLIHKFKFEHGKLGDLITKVTEPNFGSQGSSKSEPALQITWPSSYSASRFIIYSNKVYQTSHLISS